MRRAKAKRSHKLVLLATKDDEEKPAKNPCVRVMNNDGKKGNKMSKTKKTVQHKHDPNGLGPLESKETPCVDITLKKKSDADSLPVVPSIDQKHSYDEQSKEHDPKVTHCMEITLKQKDDDDSLQVISSIEQNQTGEDNQIKISVTMDQKEDHNSDINKKCVNDKNVLHLFEENLLFQKNSRNDGIFSAPNSVFNPISDVLENPASAPLPVSLSGTPSNSCNLSGTNSPTSASKHSLHSPAGSAGKAVESKNSSVPTSPVRDPYLGCIPIKYSSETDFTDSSTSWVPNSDEEVRLTNFLKIKRKRSSFERDDSIEDFLSRSIVTNLDNTEKNPTTKNVTTETDNSEDEDDLLVKDEQSGDLVTKAQVHETTTDADTPENSSFADPGSSNLILDDETGYLISKTVTDDHLGQNILRSVPPLAIVALQTLNSYISNFTRDNINTTSSTEKSKMVELEKRPCLDDMPCENDDAIKNYYPAENFPEEMMQENENNCNENSNKKRWKRQQPLKWKRNMEKEKRHAGLPYLGKTGKLMPAKLPKPINCAENKCNLGCGTFTEADRKNISKEYWSLKTFKEQKDYLLSHIDIKPVRRVLVAIDPKKRRKQSRNYFFYKGEEKIRVCMNFFTKTLSISNGPINEATKHVSDQGHYNGADKRGKRSPKNKVTKEQKRQVKDHINSFPVMESHYCRKKSSRLYLDSHLSITKMYELYKERQKSRQLSTVSPAVYRKIFCTEYNYSFFKPRKDQCMTCTKYLQNKDETLREEYEKHIQRKESAKEAKENDTERSATDKTFICATVDMQSILQIPSSDVGLLYYSRKLNVQNFTIYESKPPNNAYCVVWTEVNGKRGSVEIATALKWWFDQLPKHTKEVVLYSDTCAGQNRNQYIAAFFLYMVETGHLEIIEQKYLESGHSTMEVDSMHSAIEKEKKYSPVYSMIDWRNIMLKARSKRHRKDAPPYAVKELMFHEMIDTKKLNEQIIKNKCIDNNGDKVNWLKIKNFRFEKANPGIIKFRYNYEGPYMWIDVNQTNQKGKRRKGVSKKGKRKSQNNCASTSDDNRITQEIILEHAYSSALPISKLKKRDLMELCRKGIIPAELHGWYKDLPSVDMADRLPEPDIEEEGEDDD